MPDSRQLRDSLHLPEHEAVRLIAAATGNSLTDVRRGIEIEAEAEARVRELAARRAAGEPLQYLEGTAPFGPLDVAVDRRVLIPRPETEQLYDLALRHVGPQATVVDIGTGSGALALALKATRPGLRMLATDVSSEAIEVAAANADRLGVSVEFHRGDLFEALPPELRGSIDVVVSNPPYISESEFTSLPVDVRDHEPRGALVAGVDGLAVIRRLLADAGGWLAPSGQLLVEIGEDQQPAALELVPADWLATVVDDLAGRPRFLHARRTGTVEEAAAALAAGMVVGVPTDTVYGLAAPVDDPHAVQRLYAAKGRPEDKPIPVLAASVSAVSAVGLLNDRARELARRYWPGPLTLVVPMRAVLAAGVGDHHRRTVAVRIPDHPVALQLLERTGPLAVTSANLSGGPPARDAREAWTALGAAPAVYLPGTAGGGTASTVADLTGDAVRVVRPGPIDLTTHITESDVSHS